MSQCPPMLFADVSLARRIEAAECRLSVDIAEAVHRQGDDDVLIVSVGGGAAVFTAPGSPINKVIGMGFDGPLADEAIADVEAQFAARTCPVQAEVSTLADASIPALLTRRGYVLVGFENVLGRPVREEAAPPWPDALRVTADDVDLRTWMEVVVAGFAQADGSAPPSHESFSDAVLEHTYRALAGSPGFRYFVAHWNGVPCGGASVKTCAGVAQLCGAATLPAFRRRGVQSALLQARLADAARQGCDIAVVTTQPGSRSQQNAQRQGFQLLYPRAILVRELV